MCVIRNEISTLDCSGPRLTINRLRCCWAVPMETVLLLAEDKAGGGGQGVLEGNEREGKSGVLR